MVRSYRGLRHAERLCRALVGAHAAVDALIAHLRNITLDRKRANRAWRINDKQAASSRRTPKVLRMPRLLRYRIDKSRQRRV